MPTTLSAGAGQGLPHSDTGMGKGDTEFRAEHARRGDGVGGGAASGLLADRLGGEGRVELVLG